jgi:hypothetical protein
MGAVDVDEAAEQLYALAPAEFTARRTALAAQTRRDGRADVAKEISELRRPTASAGLINQLFRAESADLSSEVAGSAGRPSELAGELAEQLRALGVELREAQAELDGARMRELTRQRQQLIAALVGRAGELAAENGQKVSGAVERELEETFAAAVADEQACLAVTSGRLTRALVYAGLGEVDVSAATATPLTRKPPPKPRPAQPTTDQTTVGQAPTDLAERRRAAELAKLTEATETLSTAQTSLAEAEAELTARTEAQQTAQAHEAKLSNRLDELQREILQTRHELDAAARATANADRDQRRQERQVEEARKATRLAQQARDRLAPND